MLTKMNSAFCIECREETDYELKEETRTRIVKEKEYHYKTIVAYCKKCGEEVSVPGLADKDMELFDTCYRQTEDIISLSEIRSLMDTYHLGKAPLSLTLGFGEVTISRYFDGQIPSKKYSDIMRTALYYPEYMLELLHKNRQKIRLTAYQKALKAIQNAMDTPKATPEIQTIINYILNEVVEITPLALQKLLYFSQGLYLARHKTPLFNDNCEAWIHGPVYPEVYNQYKQYGYNPIEDEGVFLKDDSARLSDSAKEILNLVINSFGIYSGKFLEKITHKETPWITARGGIESIEYSKNPIPKESIQSYFEKIQNQYGMSNCDEVKHYIQDMTESITKP